MMWPHAFIPALTASVIAVPLNVVHERRVTTPGDQPWKISSLDVNTVVPVRIGLVQRNLEKGYDHVMDIADPGSTNYGKHWTAEEIEAEFSPAHESFELVKDWLEQQGIESYRTSKRGWISFNASVYQVEKMFDAELREYTTNDGVTRLGCEKYSLPHHLTAYVDYITPGVRLSSPMRKTVYKREITENVENSKGRMHAGLVVPIEASSDELRTSSSDTLSLPPDIRNCGLNITAPCYRALYNIPAPDKCDIPSGAIGVFEEYSYYAQADLDDFFTAYAPYVPNGTHPYPYSVNDAQPTVPQNEAGVESDVDFDLIYSLLGAANVSLYQAQPPASYTGGVFDEFFDPLLDAIDESYCDEEEKSEGFQCGSYPLSTVLSLSYVPAELFVDSQASQARVCNEFMKLSLQGHTIIVASGDYGVATNPGFGHLGVANGCIPRDLNNTGDNLFLGDIFTPSFPANCPYVLSTGATQLLANETIYDPESVMHVPGIANADPSKGISFSSGGGFSNYFPRPSYQDDLVGAYLQTHVPDYPYYESNFIDVTSNATTIGQNNGVYNRNGRAIPDVSANGVNLTTFNQGVNVKGLGTSLAAPIWAAIITMLNAERAAANKSSVGFVQPTLYQNPQAFHDITIGTNPGCNTQGFPAVEGWDPSTGLGTPDYKKLSALFNSLP